MAEATAAGLGIMAMKTQAGAYWDKEKQQPINMRAALKWVLNDPNVTTAIPGFTTFDQLKEDFSVVTDITLTPQDLKDLRLGEQVAGLYCQQCGQCLAGCPKGLPIPDLMRSYMYAYGYKNLHAAHELVGSLDIPGEPCGSCASCTAVCAKGFDIADRVRDINRLRAVPATSSPNLKRNIVVSASGAPSEACLFGSSPFSGNPLEAARDFASKIPVRGGGPAQRGEPDDWFPGGRGARGISRAKPERGASRNMNPSSCPKNFLTLIS